MTETEAALSRDVQTQTQATRSADGRLTPHTQPSTQNAPFARCYPRTEHPSLSPLSQKALHFLLHHGLELILGIRQQRNGRGPFRRFQSGYPRLEVVGFHPQYRQDRMATTDRRAARAAHWGPAAAQRCPAGLASAGPGSRPPPFPVCFFTSIVAGSAASASPSTLDHLQ